MRARAEAIAAHARFVELAGEPTADAWRDGLGEAIAALATGPRRCPIAAESARFRGEVRQLVYRRTTSSAAYRVLFCVQEDSPDGPVVIILTLRHGAQRPITRAESRCRPAL